LLHSINVLTPIKKALYQELFLCRINVNPQWAEVAAVTEAASMMEGVVENMMAVASKAAGCRNCGGGGHHQLLTSFLQYLRFPYLIP
jgi:hypothetical protein